MSLKSNEVFPVDAELIYETPDKRRKTRSRKAAEPEKLLSAEIESLFASYSSLTRKLERDMRELTDKAIPLLTPLIVRIRLNALRKGRDVKALVAEEEITNMFYFPLCALKRQAQELRMDFCNLERLYSTLASLIEDDDREEGAQ